MNKSKVKMELIKIQKANQGILRPEDVVKAAKNPDHPLHRYFEWSNAEAAEQYRISQARHLIRHVKLKIEVPSQDPQIVNIITTRMFTSLPSNRGPYHEYQSTEAILKIPEKRQELLEMAYSDLEAFQRKYQTLDELSQVFQAIDVVIKKKRTKVS